MKTKLTIGGAILAVATTLPVFPTGDMQLLYSYQQEASYVEPIVDSSTTTPAKPDCPTFDDGDANGIVSVSVFKDSNGDIVCVQIPDKRYEDMGKWGGIKNNPTKTEWQSALDLVTNPTPASAAVAYGHVSSAQNTSAVTSITIAHTATGDNLLVTGLGLRKNASGGLCTGAETPSGVGITYNSVAMTIDPSIQYIHDGNCAFLFAFSLANPTSGSNNVVASWTLASRVAIGSVSFSGAGGGVGTSVTAGDQNCGVGASVSMSRTITADDMLFGLVVVADQANTITWTGGETSRFEQNLSGVQLSEEGATETGSGLVTMTGNAASVCYVAGAIPILAPVAAVVLPSFWGAGTIMRGTIYH